MIVLLVFAWLSALGCAQIRNDQFPMEDGLSQTWLEKYGSQIDQPFSGPLAFSHLPYTRCLEDEAERFDIAILGIPFDTTVSYRPGARFGPYAIRSGSRRQRGERGYTMAWGNNPYKQGVKVVDCGDVPVSPFDNALALDQMEVAYSTLLARPLATQFGANKWTAPRIVSLGGDHTIVLPILRALYKHYGEPVSVLHFDAHLVEHFTRVGYPGSTTEQSKVTHGTFFHIAHEEGLMATNKSIHAGIRCKLGDATDLEHDEAIGFQLISTDDIDDLGIPEIIRRIRARVGTSPLYLSLDIDVIAGTPEAGGWTTRELKRIIRGLAGLNFVGADIVEVSPAYDFAEVTGIAAADLVHDFLSMFLSEQPPSNRHSLKVTPKDEL
ncbi:hypothetical protein C8J57DRAFT_1428789 [Mycena rebaudengoi]|nr:hypothetical protein C8J57DRAFT_1428789 [Mycena rebaudengoi]